MTDSPHVGLLTRFLPVQGQKPHICGKGNSMKIKALLGGVLLAGLFTACGNSNTTKASNLTGTWAFTAQSMPFNYT
jgi:hypothetical protein